MITDAVKAAPPLAITGMTVMGFPMSDWVLLLTAIYTTIQIVALVRRFLVSYRLGDRRFKCDDAADCPIVREARNGED